MAGFEHLISDPPASPRLCFAEGCSAPNLAWHRVQQLAVCAMVLDAVVNDRDYEFLERELISDWRMHYAPALGELKGVAQQALTRVLERDKPDDRETSSEIDSLLKRLSDA